MSAGSPLADQDARNLIATALDDTLVVEAAAGTGKTTELVKRMLHVLATGRADVTTIVAVTFTEKAAGELKLRLRQELESARHDSGLDAAARRRLEAALTKLEEAHVGTVHAFCADLLREHPVEAGLDPLFTVLTEAQARRYYDEAFAAWFQEALAHAPEGVRRSLRRSSRPGVDGEDDAGGPVDRLRRAGWDLVQWRDFPASWTRPAFERRQVVDALADQVHAFADLTARAANVRDTLFVDTAPARRVSDELRLALSADDHDTAEAILVDLRRERDFQRARKGRGAAYGPGIQRADVQTAHRALLALLDEFAAAADADLAALLHEELQGSLDRYQDLKARHGALDFLDLLLSARDLVRDRPSVRAGFQRRFERLFVDEFQDTDPLQVELLLLLAASDPAESAWRKVEPLAGKLFIVGDPKQSIYRFRRADVGIYRDVCEQLVRSGARIVHLTTSFRGVPNLQRAVNAAFAPSMTGNPDTLQADYVPLRGDRPQPSTQPSLVALPVPEPYGVRRVSGIAIERSLPDALGAFVEWLVRESGWTVTQRRTGEQRVAVGPRHVCILFRRFVSWGTDTTRAYVDALEARGIAHLLVGGRAFHDREEVETLRAALAAVEWPDDELSVFATLRGALFAIGDEALLEYRTLPGVRGFHSFRFPDSVPEHLAPIPEALGVLAELHRARNHRPVAATIDRLLGQTRAHVGFALRRAGEQVLANVLHVAELARQYEAEGGISFRGFVDELREAVDEGISSDAPIVEEGSDGVRLMTVHKAKGLEFPVVILADMTAKLSLLTAARHVDPVNRLCAQRIGGWSPRDLVLNEALEIEREREEGVRVAYVAATRARDLLVVPAIGDQAYDRGWVSPLDRAVYPEPARMRTPDLARGCPSFRKDSVLTRPDNEVAGAHTVCPGRHEFESDGGTFDAVWWDPAELRLGAESPFGLRREELIAKDVAPEVVADRQRAFLDWRAGRDAAVQAGSVSAFAVRTATEWAMDAPVDEAAFDDVEVDVVALDALPGRPVGVRYGTLVHAALETVPFDADRETIERIVVVQGRVVGATSDEVRSATDVAQTVLEHPLLGPARDALDGCLREMPVTTVIDGVLIEGVVDLAFDTDDGMVVVDFKTDRAEGELLNRYKRQVALYARAVSTATGRPARAVLLQV